MLQSTAIQYFAAYQQAQETVPKIRQVIMLYDGLIRYLRQAKEFGEQREYEKQHAMLDHARKVVLALQGSLDFNHGGEVSRSLDKFYQGLYIQLFQLHVNENQNAWLAVMDNITMLKNAWIEVDKQLL